MQDEPSVSRPESPQQYSPSSSLAITTDEHIRRLLRDAPVPSGAYVDAVGPEKLRIEDVGGKRGELLLLRI